MVTILRTAVIAPGKTGDAIAFAHHIVKYLKEKHGVNVELLMPVGGNPGRIAWRTDYESLGQWETMVVKLMADADYMGSIAKHSDLFLAGSVHDDIWRKI